MKTLTLTIAATILSTTAALASTDISDFDTNGDRFASKSEVAAVFPGFSGTDFRSIDVNRDQRISAAELQQPGARSVVARYEPANSGVSGIADIDKDADGFATYKELVAEYPGLTPSQFRQIDINDDRRVSFVELYNPVSQSLVSLHDGGGVSLTGIEEIDVNGDNFASFDELKAKYPGLGSNDWNRIDGNNDNRLSFNELYRLETQVVLDRSGS